MPENIRPTYPPMPSNPPRPQGAVGNVGADSGSQINPEPAVGIQPPSNPAAGQGAVSNIGGSEKPLIRHEMPK